MAPPFIVSAQKVMHLIVQRKRGKRVVWCARCDPRIQYDVKTIHHEIAMIYNDGNFWNPQQPSAAGHEKDHRCRRCAAAYVEEELP